MTDAMNRRRFLARGATLAAAGMMGAAGCGGLSRGAKRRAGDRPNIVFVLADDLGYGDLGCYGQEQIQTPRLDQLAREGARLTQHYAGSTVCAPSRCVLMTGLHTGHARVRANGAGPLRPEDTTVAEWLRRAGYRTGLIGKWGLGEEGTTGIPTRQGFDYFFGYLNQRHAHNYYPDFLWRNEEKVRLPNEVQPARGPDDLGGVSTNKAAYSHDLFTQEALEFIDREKANPFFLYLAYTIPHANNEAGKQGMEVPSLEPYADRDWPDPQKGHAAMITRMDRDIGRLVDHLDDLGLGENTLILFSSDNGPHGEGGADPEFFDSNGPLRGMKRDVYDGGIRVPAIARWPGRIPKGETVDYMSGFQDFFPTACEAAGVEPPEGLDGLSILPALTGPRNAQRRHAYLYWEFYGGGRQAVRFDNWKAVRHNARENPDAPVELYDLSKDPGEEHNRADLEVALTARARRLMQQAHRPDGRWRFD